MAQAHLHDNVNWYMSELTSRVVAKSGIPTDRFHIGKVILQCFNDDLDFVSQIDGGTGESETNGSILKRSIQCAISLKQLGLKQGDVMVLMAPNHLNLAVPFYAAMYLGIVSAPVDRTLRVNELERTFSIYKPSIVLCQSDKILDIQAALERLKLNTKIVTFDKQGHNFSFIDLLKVDDKDVINFKAEDFNAEEAIGFILPTSGSTGLPKGAAIPYKSWMITGPNIWARYLKFPSPTRMWLVLSPLQWLTATSQFIISPFMKYTRLQTSNTVTVDHSRYLINTYKPTGTILSSTMIVQLLKPGEQGPCDVSSFDSILIGGSTVPKETVLEIKRVSPRTTVVNAYGMTELTSIAFQGECPPGSSGKPAGIYQHRLVDLDTLEDIDEPNVKGELWIKSPALFKEYYNSPKETKEAFAQDGWFKTGDMFYRDEQWNFFFVERIKLLLKYKHFQISPAEIENVVREHPGVLDVVVTGISDPECGDLPVACVITKPGHSLTALEIKELVKENMSDAKQLRGGVVFMSTFPLTASTKIDRRKINEMIREIDLQ